tara:strand:+ start:405 stop:755 length:351 start_codon:yes stop_codon:yes gene_type:complete
MTTLTAQDNTVFTVASDQLDDADYDKIIPFLKEKIAEYGTINWFFEMTNFKGWTLSALWRDAKFDIKHKDNLSKIAMVGEKKWEEAMTTLMKPFTDTEIKFFDLGDREHAKQWINS